MYISTVADLGALYTSSQACDHWNLTSLIGGKRQDRLTSIWTRTWGPVTIQNLKSLIGGNCQDRPTSVYTRAWGPEEPWTWMDHGVSTTWHTINIFFMVYPILRHSPPQRGGSNTKPVNYDTSKSPNPWHIENYRIQGSMSIRGW